MYPMLSILSITPDVDLFTSRTYNGDSVSICSKSISFCSTLTQTFAPPTFGDPFPTLESPWLR